MLDMLLKPSLRRWWRMSPLPSCMPRVCSSGELSQNHLLSQLPFLLILLCLAPQVSLAEEDS